MADYFVIKSKLNNLVLQIDEHNLLKTKLGIQTEQFWVVTGHENQADNQLWMLTSQGQIQSKFNGLVLDIGTKNLLDIYGQINQYYNHLKAQGIVFPPLVATLPEAGKLTQQWTKYDLAIRSSKDGKALDIFGASLDEYVPITVNSLVPDSPNQQWEFFTPRQPSPTTEPSPTMQPSPTTELSPTTQPLPTTQPSPTTQPLPTTEPSPTLTRDTLHSGEVLKPGQCLTSANGIYSFCYQTDANLVLYENREKPNMRVVWHANSNLHPPAFQCHLQQSDGNLVVYNTPGHATWFTDKFGTQYPPSKLIVQNEGNVVIYDRNGTPYWNSLEDTGVSKA